MVRRARGPESPRRAGPAPRAYRQATIESLKAGHRRWGGNGRDSTARPGLLGLRGGLHPAAPVLLRGPLPPRARGEALRRGRAALLPRGCVPGRREHPGKSQDGPEVPRAEEGVSGLHQAAILPLHGAEQCGVTAGGTFCKLIPN